uniref:NADH-ubiquinone oxidoreductase chain 6 n=1 Tax=Harpochytrium sp. JEL105 TaxID=224131 RepID=Q85ME1_9FUNG|nr:NADH dehydrogenase subunit 6 [Harpochytrium sp. JEL105]AAO64941.1 NADH dehydrogenase subunit 6 [Harpochytrium sp. JEL105]
MINYWLYETFLVLIGLSGVLVIVSRSPINSVLFLCGLYLAGGGIFLLLDHYFLGLTLIIVYVGAIAILFLFTIFMINVRLTLQLGSFASPLAAFALLIGFGLYFLLFADFSSYKDLPILSSILGSSHSLPVDGINSQILPDGAWENSLRSLYASDWSHLLGRPSDLTMLANMIFYAYPLALILVGFLLLVVMVAIIKIHLDTH